MVREGETGGYDLEEDEQGFVKFGNLEAMENELEEFDVSDMQTGEKRYLLKTRELNQRMFRDRHLLSFWVELLEVQDLAKETIFSGKEKLIVDKKLSILERAFEIPNLQRSTYLRLLQLDLLRVSEKNEDSYKLVIREFSSMLQNLPDPDGQVLTLFLDFKHSHFTNFSASLLRKSIGESVASFKGSLESASSTAAIKKFETLLFVVLVYGLITEFRMGYCEKSIGVLLALTQINVVDKLQTTDIGTSWDDHSIPKVGEQNQATGEDIFQFEESMHTVLGDNTLEAQQRFYSKEAHSYEQLSEKEQLYSKIHWRPANTKHDQVHYP